MTCPEPPNPDTHGAGGQRLAPGVSIPRQALRFSFSRSGGPGGQAVNKINTRAELRIALADLQGLSESALHRLRRMAGRRLTQNDELIIIASTHRSQLDNKLACMDRLCELVSRAQHAPKIRRKSKPTRSMIERRLESKRKTSQKKSLRRSRDAD